MNYTPNFHLPLYEAGDDTSYLTNWNESMSTIDTEIGDAQAGTVDQTARESAAQALETANTANTAAQAAQTTADSALADSQSALNNINAIILPHPFSYEDKVVRSALPYTIDEDGLYEISTYIDAKAGTTYYWQNKIDDNVVSSVMIGNINLGVEVDANIFYLKRGHVISQHKYPANTTAISLSVRKVIQQN